MSIGKIVIGTIINFIILCILCIIYYKFIILLICIIVGIIIAENHFTLIIMY